MKENSQEFLLMQKGESYRIDDCLFGYQKKCAQLLSKLNSLPFGDEERENICHLLFKHYGKNNILKEGFRCNYGFNISIGDSCYINFNCVMLDSCSIEIGNRVFIAPSVIISPVTHPLAASKRKDLIIKKIVIEDDVWIGAGSIILPGVRLGKGSVIGANSLVKEDVKPFTVVAGSPARFIKDIEEE